MESSFDLSNPTEEKLFPAYTKIVVPILIIVKEEMCDRVTIHQLRVAVYIKQIPPTLPLPKGGTIPLFGKEGRGEILW